MKQGNVDIVAVAKLAGVSPSTVSRSFNHPDLVKLSTRRKIERAVQKLGYIRNRAAQAIHGKRSATIGLVVPTVNHAIFSEVIQSFAEAIDAAGFTLLIASHGYSLQQEYAILRKFLEHRVDGVALIGLDHHEAAYQLLKQQDVPAIAIWNYKEDARMPCVGIRNEDAGRLVAEHLISLGHRRVGFVFPPTEDNDRARARLSGAIAAFEAEGLAVPAERRRTVEYSIAAAKSMCAELLHAAPKLTAILCGNDVIAQGAVYACLARSVKVPDDMSIIGIGDFPGSSDMEPALTTVRIPARSIGSLAGRELAKAIVENTGASSVQIELDLQLCLRATTARARNTDVLVQSIDPQHVSGQIE